MIALERVTKHYNVGPAMLPVLRGLTFSIKRGEFVAIMGPSGSGKSTLLNILGLLDRYDTGQYHLDGRFIKDISETKAASYRSHLIGFVFQSFNLIPFKTALDNVALPLYYQKIPRRQREAKALGLLEHMGLGDRAGHLPSELSGGQRQRIAIARALINDPPLILADEPTGNLDSERAHEVMRLLSDINREGRTLVMVTHDSNMARAAHRTIMLNDGVVVSGEVQEQ
jgi:putative ABC transport system ATP-binding protein